MERRAGQSLIKSATRYSPGTIPEERARECKGRTRGAANAARSVESKKRDRVQGDLWTRQPG